MIYGPGVDMACSMGAVCVHEAVTCASWRECIWWSSAPLRSVAWRGRRWQGEHMAYYCREYVVVDVPCHSLFDMRRRSAARRTRAHGAGIQSTHAAICIPMHCTASMSQALRIWRRPICWSIRALVACCIISEHYDNVAPCEAVRCDGNEA